MKLAPHGPQSYQAHSSPAEVSIWLQMRGFIYTKPRSEYEYARLELRPPRGTHWSALIIVYRNGTLLLQGTDQGIAEMRYRIAGAVDLPAGQEVMTW